MSADITMAIRLRHWREWAYLTRAQVARAIGISREAVMSWESGKSKPTHDNLELFCLAIGITLADFHDRMPPDGARRADRQEAKSAC